MNDTTIIVLAAGKGTRMSSLKPKVLHTINRKPLINHSMKKLTQLKPKELITVVGHKKEQIIKCLGNDKDYAYQYEQLGTGHAVEMGLSKSRYATSTIIVVNSDDSALYSLQTLQKVIDTHRLSKKNMTILTCKQTSAEIAGRLVRDEKGEYSGIKLVVDMTLEEMKYKSEIVCGFYIFDRSWLEERLPSIKKGPKGEYNLTDLINAAISEETLGGVILSNKYEWVGINTKKELQRARYYWRRLHK